MFDDKKREALSHSDHFKDFLEEVFQRRESAIQQLHDRPTDSVQQLAGRILEADDILRMGGWEEIQKRRA